MKMTQVINAVLSVLLLSIVGCAGPQLSASPPESDIRIQNLRCEYLEDPLAIGVTVPRLSWTLDCDTRAQKQTAYQILVASSPGKLANGTGDLWDTGMVKSDRAHSDKLSRQAA